MPQLQHARSRTQRFTVDEAETEDPETLVLARTKRYTFYWLLGGEPILLRVVDVDGTDLTDEVDPPDGMVQRLAQTV